MVLAAPARAGKKPVDTDEAHFTTGARAFDQDDYVTAVEQLKLSVEAKPALKSYMLLGNAHIKLGQFDEARAAFQKALALDKRAKQRATVTRLLKVLDEIATAKLRIESSPPGAKVYVDLMAAGARGQTPLSLALTPGSHRVILQLDGYDDGRAVPDPVALAGKEVQVVVTLQQRGCDLTLAAKPVGKTAQQLLAGVDGGELFALPTTVRVSPGAHHVVFNGKALVSKDVPVVCKDFVPLHAEESLEKAPGGVLAVHARHGSLVHVDDKAIGDAEASGLALPAGEHRVAVEEAGKAPWHAVVSVRAGEQTDITAQPDVGQLGGTGLSVALSPSSARLLLDGNPIVAGETVAVQPGRHTLDARAPGHRPHLRVLDLKRGDLASVELTLEPFSRLPLVLGFLGTGLAAVAEAVAIAGHVEANGTVANSPSFQRWHVVEVGGQVAAGTLAASAVAAYVAYWLELHRGAESNGKSGKGESARATPAAPLLVPAVSPTTQGATLDLAGRF